jgi:hypothetical protein
MNKNAIVTLADSNYFEMLIELIESIKRFPESKNVSICVLDAGLEKNQIEELNKRVFSIKKANWDIDLPFFKKKREWLKSQVSRAFLPNYFPDFEKYLWLDSDAWVNSWECVENYFKACNNDKLGITQTIGPGYKITSKVKWLMGKFALIKTQNYKHAKSSGIPEEQSRKLAFAPHLNIGVFSLQKSSPTWSIWQNNLKKTLSKGKVFGSEGLAINICVYINNVPTEFLPLNHNWILSNLLPVFDENTNTFREPYIPNTKIGIMHLAAGIWKDNKDMRIDKNIKIKIKTTEGETIEKSLRFNN